MTLIDHDPDDAVLFPHPRAELPPATESVPGQPGAPAADGGPPPEASDAFYAEILESQCGNTDDSQPVELYDGSLGVTVDFVATHQRPVGQLQWNDDLADRYANPGNVNNVRWCTGTLISESLFLTAGHCFDSTPHGWIVPRVDGTSDPIEPAEIATNIHVNFNYQVDDNGVLREPDVYAVEELVEYRRGGLDMAIVRLAGQPGKVYGMGRLAAGDPDVGDMTCIIGHPEGVPKRIEAGPVTAFEGHRIRYNDIDTLGGNSGSAIWHSPTGEIVGVHTNGGCNVAGTGSNYGVRLSRLRQESPTIRELDSHPLVVPGGTYTVQQRSNNRYLDGYTNSNDRAAMTRTEQGNDTQRWVFDPVGMVYSVCQVSTDRFLDAYESSNDHSAITRAAQANDTQLWVLLPVPGRLATYTMQQLSSGRFLDAHESAGNDFSAVTRDRQDNDTQRWAVASVDEGVITLRQVSSGRVLEAYEGTNDSSAVTRPADGSDRQRWRLLPVGSVHTIQQVSTGRFLNAYPDQVGDFAVVTRTGREQNDLVPAGHLWVARYEGGWTHRIQQLATQRYLDAQTSSNLDFRAMTRNRQDNDTQRWLINVIPEG